MITVDMYQIGEEVLIRAKVTDIVVENGEIKYLIKAEHSNNALDHKFTDHQLIPVDNDCDLVNKDEKVEEEDNGSENYIEEAEKNYRKAREDHR